MKTERSSRNALPFGTVLNGVYTVEAELGHGGVGIVYRAKHRELGPVAIKEYLPTELVVREGQSVHPVNTDSRGLFEEGLVRFLDEAKQLIRFRTHPSIVSCRDFFRANGTAYLVMDLEEGMSLSELLQAREAEGRPFDETDLLTVMVPLLEGLDLVHAAGVLHRDIKPANILIRREDDRPVLIDFGAAKQEFAQHSKSLAPFSPGYAAIEQVAEGRLGTWTDMYGIGAVMWRMVAGGNRPYEPLHPVRVERRAHAKFRGDLDPMPSAQTLGKGRFSQHILAAIDQCLELRETDRVQGCKELLQRVRETRKPAPGIVETTAKEGQPAERQPISHTAPNSKERHKKAIPAQRRSSGSGLKRSINTVMAVICTGLIVLIPILTILGIEAGVGMGSLEIIFLTFVWGLALIVALSVKNRRKRERAARHNAQGKEKAGWLYLVLLILCGVVGSMVLWGISQENNIVIPRSFTLGSHADDVWDIQGEPSAISRYSDHEIWRWDDIGSVKISLPDRRVTEWANDEEERNVWSDDLKVNLDPGPNVTEDLFFKEGSHSDDVVRLQGTPSSINGHSDHEIWEYGYSSVRISLPDRQVAEWTNIGNLRVNLDEGPNVTDDLSFTKGYHVADVLRLQGTPSRIRSLSSISTLYPPPPSSSISQDAPPGSDIALCYESGDCIYIHLSDLRVTGWVNNSGNLKVKSAEEARATRSANPSGTIEGHRGGTGLVAQDQDQTASQAKTLETIATQESTRTRRLSDAEAVQITSNINERAANNANSGASFFTRGSHADDVLRIQGTPTSIITLYDEETWYYGSSHVTLSLPDKRVTDWTNYRNTLKVQMQPGRNVTSASFFTRGSHADDVLRIQGTPTSIITLYDEETWYYGSSHVTLSLPDKRVTDWTNYRNTLKVQMQPGRNVTSASFFTRGSHADDVLRIQGTPTSIITLYDEETWYYGSSHVTLSLPDKRVTDWTNYRNTLKVQMQPGTTR